MDGFAARSNPGTIPITALSGRAFDAWLRGRSAATRNWLKDSGFANERGKVALVPGKDGKLVHVVLGLGDEPTMWDWAAAATRLPAGRYAFDPSPPAELASEIALAWALALYRFDRYKAKPRAKAVTLVWPAGADRTGVTTMADAIMLGRDLVNTPAGDMGPAELCDAAIGVAKRWGATHQLVVGEGLLQNNYPTIHAVGRASSRAPRLFDMRWGDAGAPKLTLVGKGVCFDSGGLDLKTASGMRLMKKDMGGAASVLTLAQLVMGAGLPVRLRVLVPAVENSVSANAYRPGDVIRTRKGLTVEIGNTDAEGRLILCDALAEADTEDPELIVDFATLTGAARVALGTEVPALFTTDDAFAASVVAAGKRRADPVWQLPLHGPYRKHLDSAIADLNNVGSVSEGGAITAALFLREFVGKRRRWAHVDTMAWNVSARPGRPQGGEIMGVRAMFDAIAERFSAKTKR
jgi:leucyl aminopeptidase